MNITKTLPFQIPNEFDNKYRKSTIFDELTMECEKEKKITRKRLIEHSRKAFSTILLGKPDKNLTDLNPFWPASFSKVASLALEGLGDLSVHVQSN